MEKYKCTAPGCKYVSEDAGECCNQSLTIVSDKEHDSHEEPKKEHGHGKCDCC